MTNASNQPPAAASGTFTLGNELTVRRMGFGAMRITGPGIWGEPADKPTALAVLRRAIELGVNFIDTADSYGPHVSEELIAEALYPYPADLVIATKGGLLRSGPDQWQRDGRPEHLREALEGSLRRLRVDHIDLYQFHRIDEKVPLEDSVGALEDLRRAGKIRLLGISNVDADQLARASKITPIVSVQNLYNIADRTSEEVLHICERDHLAFIPWRPVQGNQHQQNEALSRFAARHGATIGQINLAWLLHHSRSMLPIPGTASLQHLEENVASAAIQLSQEEYEELSTAQA
ncbi:oxidoreductase [Reticulibacter mediterranei]|uniref:Oxidoreductase n=1 Tax=Reticulibacter mediterranei TaxID=2778369 RepID=A0A8J3IQX5_9CHLR|nr:aldo/keto reductase [Reticulibacter mediterranei]GHO96875.1 oxidoreductase [Reticulibacter mediterranei]